LVIGSVLVILVPVLGALVLTASHADVTSDTDTATLLSNGAAESSALGQAWEFLRGEDNEGRGLDFQAMGDVGIDTRLRVGAQCRAIVWVHVLGVLEFLVKREAQTVLSFVADRQVGEDEVASLAWAVEISHTGDWSSRKDRGAGRVWWSTPLRNGPGILKGSWTKVSTMMGRGTRSTRILPNKKKFAL
jgi:hypothetical protein